MGQTARFNSKPQKLVKQPLVNLSKTGRAVVLPAPLVLPALETFICCERHAYFWSCKFSGQTNIYISTQLTKGHFRLADHSLTKAVKYNFSLSVSLCHLGVIRKLRIQIEIGRYLGGQSNVYTFNSFIYFVCLRGVVKTVRKPVNVVIE